MNTTKLNDRWEIQWHTDLPFRKEGVVRLVELAGNPDLIRRWGMPSSDRVREIAHPPRVGVDVTAQFCPNIYGGRGYNWSLRCDELLLNANGVVDTFADAETCFREKIVSSLREGAVKARDRAAYFAEMAQAFETELAALGASK